MHTRRCFHEAHVEIWAMRVSVRSQQIKGGCHRETLILWISNNVSFVSVVVFRVFTMWPGPNNLQEEEPWAPLPSRPSFVTNTHNLFSPNLPSRVLNTHTHTQLPFHFPIRHTTSRPGLYCCQAPQWAHHAPAVGSCYWPYSQQDQTQSTKLQTRTYLTCHFIHLHPLIIKLRFALHQILSGYICGS